MTEQSLTPTGPITPVTPDTQTNAQSDTETQPTPRFGTDGWRALIGQDFNFESLARVADATARAYRQLPTDSRLPLEMVNDKPNTLIIGYDCRQDAGKYAAFFAEIVSSHGFDVLVSDRYCPTPALCWTVAHNQDAIGGIMLTASHNAAEYLGVKLRMSDGGASPAWFSERVENLLNDVLPTAYDRASSIFEQAQSAEPDFPSVPISSAGFQFADIVSDYLSALKNRVDHTVIAKAGLSVVLDPMYGAARGYLAALLTEMGVEVLEVNGTNDPTFAGLHPEPIEQYVHVGAAKVVETGFAADLINDGDADRIGAVDSSGKYVTTHRLAGLLISHLVNRHGLHGRVVRNLAGSNLIRRLCDRLELPLTTTPVGFKNIYEEMLHGDVMFGGEESGGFGIPDHVRERDGLLMALLLVEMMATEQKTLAELVDQLLDELGTLEYGRDDLTLSEQQKSLFEANYIKAEQLSCEHFASLFSSCGETLVEINRSDGVKFEFDSDAWLLARLSGTEPLVRIYAEAADQKQVRQLLDIGGEMARGTLTI